jgi:DNA-binding Lrp family transcriptional regulator
LDALDSRDREILRLLLLGLNNKGIAARVKIPMSTVQRRTRKLFEKGIVKTRIELDYQKLGLRRGLLHVYSEGDVHGLAENISRIPGVQNTSIHIGNSDVVGYFVFKDAGQLLGIINEVKRLDGVNRVVWSEEVMSVESTGGTYETVLGADAPAATATSKTESDRQQQSMPASRSQSHRNRVSTVPAGD